MRCSKPIYCITTYLCMYVYMWLFACVLKKQTKISGGREEDILSFKPHKQTASYVYMNIFQPWWVSLMPSKVPCSVPLYFLLPTFMNIFEHACMLHVSVYLSTLHFPLVSGIAICHHHHCISFNRHILNSSNKHVNYILYTVFSYCIE